MSAPVPRTGSAYSRSGGRLPPFVKARDVAREALSILTPPNALSVSEAAAKYRVMDEPTFRGPWDPDQVPYIVEPMNVTTSRLYNAVVFVGSARSGKTDSLVLCKLAHQVTCAPSKTLMVSLDQNSAREYSTDEIDRMIRVSPEIGKRMEAGRGANTQYRKIFNGGMRLTMGWPVIGFFAQKTFNVVLLADRDRMPDDIDGEGDPLSLGIKRTQTVGSLGCTVEESSIGRQISDKDWRPKTIHEAPPCEGILGDYNLGTRARFYYRCPSCGDEFEPRFASLKYDEVEGDLHSTAQTTYMVCDNGCVLSAADKRELNRTGRWLHESQDGTRAVPLGHPDIRKTNIASYWQKGPIARAQTWSGLVLTYLQAQEAYKRTGSEQKLQTTIETDQAEAYLPKAIEFQAKLNANTLQERASFRPLREIPAEALFVTIQVDQQGSSFECQADAWGPGLERWLVDRWSITRPPEGAPGAERDEKGETRRPIQPALYGEDWSALTELENVVFPVTGAAHGMKAVAISVDRNGPPGGTARAYQFWLNRKRAGMAHRWFLVAGEPRIKAERTVFAPPQQKNEKYKRAARPVPVLKINTTLLKDEVSASLLRDEPGPSAYHLPSTLAVNYFEEFCAEVRDDVRWEKKNGAVRNECFDLAYYGKGLVVQLGCEKAGFWDSPAPFARADFSNPFWVSLGHEVADAPSIEPPVQPSLAARLAARAKRRVKT